MSERKRTIPIVIGGSGYRDIPAADFACVKAAAKAELGRLRAAYPASEIRLLVSLAAGGDTLEHGGVVELPDQPHLIREVLLRRRLSDSGELS